MSSKDQEKRYNWVLDTHLHLYPDYDLGVFLRTLARRIKATPHVVSDAIVGGVVADTERCRGWGMLRDGTFPGVGEFPVTQVDNETLSVDVDGVTLHIFRGVQVVTQERVEVLGVVPQGEVLSAQPLEATIDQIESFRGIPVLPWSPGKWWGRRGTIIQDAFRKNPGLWAGDIPMRCSHRALRLGLGKDSRTPSRLLWGSDPLPIRGEEGMAGTLMTAVEGDPDAAVVAAEPARELSKMLRGPFRTFDPVGGPGSCIASVRRWIAARVATILND